MIVVPSAHEGVRLQPGRGGRRCNALIGHVARINKSYLQGSALARTCQAPLSLLASDLAKPSIDRTHQRRTLSKTKAYSRPNKSTRYPKWPRQKLGDGGSKTVQDVTEAAAVRSPCDWWAPAALAPGSKPMKQSSPTFPGRHAQKNLWRRRGPVVRCATVGGFGGANLLRRRVGMTDVFGPRAPTVSATVFSHSWTLAMRHETDAARPTPAKSNLQGEDDRQKKAR